MSQRQQYNPWLNRFATLTAGATFVLIFVGGLVTSTGSGLAVPDWPNTYGHFMFAFPLTKMVGGILYEHGHRMIASVVGLMTLILAIWLWRREPRPWVKWLGGMALLAVILQGVLGGITVLYLLPTPVSVMHGTLAQLFFCMTIALAFVTSREWLDAKSTISDHSKFGVQNLAVVTVAVVLMQLILGATMRHMGAGLAIPDFPLAFGKVIPPLESQAIAVHFLHRAGALLVTLSVAIVAWTILRHFKNHAILVRPTIALLVALVIQITLAAMTIWSQKAVLPTTAHVATGALILGLCFFLALRTQRHIHACLAQRDGGFAIDRAEVTLSN